MACKKKFNPKLEDAPALKHQEQATGPATAESQGGERPAGQGGAAKMGAQGGEPNRSRTSELIFKTLEEIQIPANLRGGKCVRKPWTEEEKQIMRQYTHMKDRGEQNPAPVLESEYDHLLPPPPYPGKVRRPRSACEEEDMAPPKEKPFKHNLGGDIDVPSKYSLFQWKNPKFLETITDPNVDLSALAEEDLKVLQGFGIISEAIKFKAMSIQGEEKERKQQEEGGKEKKEVKKEKKEVKKEKKEVKKEKKEVKKDKKEVKKEKKAKE